jgi:hypothetical protein
MAYKEKKSTCLTYASTLKTKQLSPSKDVVMSRYTYTLCALALVKGTIFNRQEK